MHSFAASAVSRLICEPGTVTGAAAAVDDGAVTGTVTGTVETGAGVAVTATVTPTVETGAVDGVGDADRSSTPSPDAHPATSAVNMTAATQDRIRRPPTHSP